MEYPPLNLHVALGTADGAVDGFLVMDGYPAVAPICKQTTSH